MVVRLINEKQIVFSIPVCSTAKRSLTSVHGDVCYVDNVSNFNRVVFEFSGQI